MTVSSFFLTINKEGIEKCKLEVVREGMMEGLQMQRGRSCVEGEN